MEENFILKLINNLKQDRDLRGDSSSFANWMSKLLPNSCQYCIEKHGKIFDISVLDYKLEADAHERCKCVYVPMRTKMVGTATDLGMNGADAYIVYFGHLPDYYIRKKHARQFGWQDWKGNLDDVLPGKMLGGDSYKNKEGKLPIAPGREWYEADINYIEGYRNRERILFSNDGLIFATYDHYQTFYEITR
jgi:hypothetical protein